MALSDFEATDLPGRCACGQLRRAARRISRYYDLCLAEAGLRSTQYILLGFLGSEGPMTMAQLANTMTMDRATVGHNLRPLEREGWVEIKVGATDRRVREVSITDRGHEVLLRAYPTWRRARDGFESSLGAREVADLRDLMARVIEAPLPSVA